MSSIHFRHSILTLFHIQLLIKYCAEKNLRLKVSDKILALKNFILLIKDKSITFHDEQGGIGFTLYMK